MDKITIYSADKGQAITLPRVKNIEVGADEVSKSSVMASGRKVKDVIGYRAKITAVWDWIPAQTVTALLTLLQTGEYLYAEYPAPTGDGEGYFEIDYPSLKVFCYKDGIPTWHGMTLTMTGQEVL